MQQCDVAVIGGSLCGCMAAMEAAREGAKVVLVETGTFLGNEFTRSLRPWIKSGGYEKLEEDLKKVLFSGELDPGSYGKPDSEIALYLGEIKKNLLQMLLENGVVILFMSEVVGVITEGEAVNGVLLGSKNGLKVFRTKALIDATENKRAAWFGGAKRKVYQGGITVRRTLEYSAISEPAEMSIKVPESLGIHGNKVELHHGKHQEDQYFVDFALQFKVSAGSFKEQMAMEIEARKKTVLLTEYLKQQIGAFKNAFLQQSSSQLYIPPIFDIENLTEDDEGVVGIKTCRNLFAFRADVKLNADPDCSEVARYVHIARKAGKKAARSLSKSKSPHLSAQPVLRLGHQSLELDESQLKEDKEENLGIPLYSADLSLAGSIPAIDGFDIVVSGGGTSGVPAAVASASMGAKVALIENFWELGGTKTLGGVARYYHGYRGGFTGHIDKQVLSMGERVTGRAETGHIESKMMALMQEVVNQGITPFTGTKTVGAIMKDHCLHGVVIANSDGLGVIHCKVAVDATGDGDLAAFAGAGYSYGSPRDGSVQTFNHNGYVKGSFIDLGVIDSRKTSDVMRGLYVGHRMASNYDFRPLLTVRESRRIEGDYRINIADILLNTRYEDVISMATTDCDPHGTSASWVSRLGYLPLRNGDQCAGIPYRACLPKGIEGLLVAAKAISATKDAAGFVRMSADVQNLGYAVGKAAALAHKQGVTPRNIPVGELQEILLKEDIIHPEMLKARDEEPIKEETLVNAAAEGKEEAFFPLLCRKKETVLTLLEEKYEKNKENLWLAKALAWFGSAVGVEELLKELDRLWKEEDGRFHIDLHPEKGDGTLLAGFLNKPDIYWKINQMIVLLGLAGDKAALEQICTIASATESGGQHYIVPQAYIFGKIRIDWVRVPHYDRILSLAFSLERLADPKAAPALECLIDRPYIGGYVSKEDLYAGGSYLSAYLEICVARALARCGSQKGALLLADYMEDVQAVLSDHAYHEIKEITGQDLGKDAVQWKEWIKAQEILPVKPFTGVFYEPVQ